MCLHLENKKPLSLSGLLVNTFLAEDPEHFHADQFVLCKNKGQERLVYWKNERKKKMHQERRHLSSFRKQRGTEEADFNMTLLLTFKGAEGTREEIGRFEPAVLLETEGGFTHPLPTIYLCGQGVTLPKVT